MIWKREEVILVGGPRHGARVNVRKGRQSYTVLCGDAEYVKPVVYFRVIDNFFATAEDVHLLEYRIALTDLVIRKNAFTLDFCRKAIVDELLKEGAILNTIKIHTLSVPPQEDGLPSDAQVVVKGTGLAFKHDTPRFDTESIIW